MFKLKLCELLTTCIIIPFVAVFVTIFCTGHHILAFVWVFAAAALTVFVEDMIKGIKGKFKNKH